MSLAEWAMACVVALPFALGISVSGDADRREVAFTFQDPEIVESSGLVVRDGLVVTVNDSGDIGRTFVVDPRTGQTVGGATWGASEDVEAIAPLRGDELLVGDIGDNLAARSSVQLLRVPVARGEQTVTPAVYEMTYPDGSRDAETLMVHPRTQQVFVASKGIFASTLYVAPRRLSTTEPNQLEAVGDVIGIATDGSFFPDGRHFVVRDYSRAVIYTYPDLLSVAEIDLPDQEQGEGIAVDEESAVFVSSEGLRSDVLRIELPARVARLVDPPPPTPETEADSGSEPDATSAPEPAAADVERPVWPWLLGGVAGLGMIVVLVRSLRPR